MAYNALKGHRNDLELTELLSAISRFKRKHGDIFRSPLIDFYVKFFNLKKAQSCSF